MAQLVKSLPAIRETWVWSLGWKDPLGMGKVTYSSVLAWRIPWTVESMGLQRVGHNWVTFTFIFCNIRAFQMTQWSKIHLPMQETQETWVSSPGWEDPLEQEMATHSSTLAWRIPWTEEPGGLQPMGSQRAGHDWVMNTQVHNSVLRGKVASLGIR